MIKDSLKCYWRSSEKEVFIHLETRQGLKTYVLRGIAKNFFMVFLKTDLGSGFIEISDEDSNVFRVFIEDLLEIKVEN